MSVNKKSHAKRQGIKKATWRQYNHLRTIFSDMTYILDALNKKIMINMLKTLAG